MGFYKVFKFPISFHTGSIICNSQVETLFTSSVYVSKQPYIEYHSERQWEETNHFNKGIFCPWGEGIICAKNTLIRYSSLFYNRARGEALQVLNHGSE